MGRENTIRIKNVESNLVDALKILAKDRESTIGELLKPFIKEILLFVNKMPKSSGHFKEIAVPGISNEIIDIFRSTKNNIGIDPHALIRISIYLYLLNQSDFSLSLVSEAFPVDSSSIPAFLT